MIHPKIYEIEKAIGISFNDKELLTRALIHSSYSNEHGEISYDNLEFLGDGILQSIVSIYLYSYLGNNPSNHSEGLLTEIRSRIVRKEPLIKAVKKIGLDKYILTGKGLSISSVANNKLISDVFESLVAAIYIDQGYSAARDFVINSLGEAIKEAFTTPSENYRGLLQEFVQKYKLGSIEYKTETCENGFLSKVYINGSNISEGIGKNKKSAEKTAAKKALQTLKKSRI